MNRYINRFSKERDHTKDVHSPIYKLVSGIGSAWSVETVHFLSGMMGIKITNNPKNPWAFISAGVHGDEPAGVQAVLRLLQESYQHTRWNFVIIPCVNPIGYERNIREGSEFQDINRNFHDSEDWSPENKAVLKYLSQGPYNYKFTMDLHETRKQEKPLHEYPPNARHPDGFYMWEMCPKNISRVGPRIINDVKEYVPICSWSKVWGDTMNDGVIYPEGCVGELYSEAHTFQKYMYDNYSQHSFTTETYSGQYIADSNGENLEDRVNAQLAAIRTALNAIQ